MCSSNIRLLCTTKLLFFFQNKMKFIFLFFYFYFVQCAAPLILQKKENMSVLHVTHCAAQTCFLFFLFYFICFLLKRKKQIKNKFHFILKKTIKRKKVASTIITMSILSFTSDDIHEVVEGLVSTLINLQCEIGATGLEEHTLTEALEKFCVRMHVRFHVPTTTTE